MSDLYDDIGLELEPETPGALPNPMPQKPTVVKRGTMLSKVVCLLLGFVIGAGGVVGGTIGAGYYVATQPVNKTLDAVNGITGGNIDFSQFISEDYAKLTVMGLVGELGTVAGKFANGQGCLNDLASISPYVNTALQPLFDKVGEFGLTVNKEDVMATPIGELPTYFLEAVKDIAIIDVLDKVGMTTSPLLEAVCYKEDGKPTTVRDIMEGGVESVLHGIPLEVLLIHESGVVDPDKDAMIMTLAYGNANRYTVTPENKVTMNAATFTKDGDKFYDIDGNEVTVTNEGGALTAELDGEKVYLKATGNVYYAFKEAEFTTQVSYKKIMVGDLMGGNATEIFNTIELGSLLNVSPLDENPDAITLALAYGEEGTHYVVQEGKIVWLEDENGERYKPRTIGSLLTGNVTALISDIKLATLFDLEEPKQSYAEGEEPDAITMALAFGEEGTHYDFDGEGNLVWLTDPDSATGGKFAPRTIGTLLEGDMTGLISDIKLATLFDLEEPKQRYPENEKPDAITMALAFGEEGTHYDFDGEGNLVWLTDPDSATGGKFAPRTVGTLLEGDMTGLIFDMKLGTLLDISPLDENAGEDNALMLALAYGEKGKHYKIENGELVWQDKDGDPATEDTYAPRTLNDLVNNSNTLIEEIYLGTVLGIDLLDNYDADPDNDADAMMVALAYGYEGTHYTVNDAKTEITYIQEPKSIKSLMEGNAFDELRLGTVLNVELGDPNADAMTHAVAYGYAGVDYVIQADGSVTAPDGTPYVYPTVADMSNMGDMMNDLRLATVLGVEIDDPNADAMTHALAFGYEGTDFAFDADGNAVNYGTTDAYNGYRTVADMQDMGTMLDTLRLATVLGAEIDDPNADAMTHALAFGYEGTHYEIVGGEIVWQDKDGDPLTEETYFYRTVADMSSMSDIINELRIETALGVTYDSPTFLLALAYGSEGSDPAVDGYELERDADGKAIGFTNIWNYNTIAELSDPDNNIINTLKLKDLIDVNTLQDDLLLKHLSDVSVGDMPNAIGKLTFKQVYPEQIYNSRYAYYATEGAEPLVLLYDKNVQAYYTDKAYAVGEEKEWFTGNEDDIVLEFHYEYWNVVVNDVPATEKTNEHGGYIAKDKLYYHDTCKYYHYKEGDTVYQIHLTLTGQWKYLLTTNADNEAGAGVSHDYALTEFASLVSNMTNNMTNAKLRELSADGIISLSNETLNTPLVTSLDLGPLGSFSYTITGIENPTFGDLTVTQLMEYAAQLVQFMNTLGN